MEKMVKVLVQAIWLAAVSFGLGACTSKDEELLKGNEMDLFGKLESGELSMSFESIDYLRLKKDERTGNRWEEMGDDVMGFIDFSPSLSHISEGKSWYKYMLSTISGAGPLYLPWEAYCKATGCNKTLYIADRLEYNKEEQTVKVGYKTCKIEKQTDSGFKISFIDDYGYNTVINWDTLEFTMNIGFTKIVKTCEVCELQLPNKEDIIYFNSERDLIIGVVALMRETFGDTINLKDYVDIDFSYQGKDYLYNDQGIIDPENAVLSLDKLQDILIENLDKNISHYDMQNFIEAID